jgi:hypothetical protein
MAALVGEGAALHLREERRGWERADAAPSRTRSRSERMRRRRVGAVEGEELRTIRDLGLARRDAATVGRAAQFT